LSTDRQEASDVARLLLSLSIVLRVQVSASGESCIETFMSAPSPQGSKPAWWPTEMKAIKAGKSRAATNGRDAGITDTSQSMYCNYVYNSRQESNGSEDNNNYNILSYFMYTLLHASSLPPDSLWRGGGKGGGEGDYHNSEERGEDGGNLVIPQI
jgi:hypothetical protein